MVEYLVREALNGVTPAPPLGPLLENKPLPAQPYFFEVDTLGLIDLSFDLPDEDKLDPVTTGWRYIPWIHITVGASIIFVGAAIESGWFRTPGDVSSFVQFDELDAITSTRTYSRKGYCIPQGQTLRLSGISRVLGGAPIRVRMGVLLPRTEEEEQAIREAFCCRASIPTIGGAEPGPVECPECNCGFTDFTITNDDGSPFVPPFEVSARGDGPWYRISGPEVGAFTVLGASLDTPEGLVGIETEFNELTCEWRFRFTSFGASPGETFTFSVFNPCFDTCTALFAGIGLVTP